MRPIVLLFITLLLGLAPTVTAQSYTVDGYVRDVQTGTPIRLATVRVSGTVMMARTNGEGYFKLLMPESGGLLEVSRLGYERGYMQVAEQPEGAVVIGLTEKSVELETVVIEGGLQKVLKDEKLFVKDYGHWEEYLFVLIYDNAHRQFKVAYINEQDSIMDVDFGPEPPRSLEKDCYGNVHALGDDFACQLFVTDERIRYYQDDLEMFETYVRPALGNVGPYYYYAYRKFNNQILDYYVHNAYAQQGEFFYHVEDERRIQHIMDPYPLNPFSAFIKSEEQAMALPEEFWNNLWKVNKDLQFEQLAFYKPISAPLHPIADEVVVFDHLEGFIRKFSPEGLPKEDIPIDYHKARRWDRFITVDPVRGEAYTRYIRNGWSTLAEIDLETGAVLKEWELPRQFPQKITVRDGIAYFLYAETNYDDVRRLYRYRLKD